MTYCLGPLNPDHEDAFECNNSCWHWLLMEIGLGQAIGARPKNDNEYIYTPDKYGLSPLDNGGEDENGDERCYTVNKDQANHMASIATQHLSSTPCKDVDREIINEFIYFAQNSHGFEIL